MDSTIIVSILIYLAGFFTGGAIATCALYFKIDGTLKIDHSDSKKDVYRIEIGDLDVQPYKKHIVLKVENDADLRWYFVKNTSAIMNVSSNYIFERSYVNERKINAERGAWNRARRA